MVESREGVPLRGLYRVTGMSRGPFLGVPIIRIILYVVILGSRYLRKLPNGVPQPFNQTVGSCRDNIRLRDSIWGLESETRV